MISRYGQMGSTLVLNHSLSGSLCLLNFDYKLSILRLYTVKVPFEAALLIEAAVGLEGPSLVECVYIKHVKIQESI